MRNCNQCGAALSESSRFCSQCGVSAVDQPDKPSTALPEVPPAAASPDAQFCGLCGARIPASCAYCLVCGVKAGEAPPPEESLPALESGTDSPVAAVSRKNRHSGLISAGITISVLLALTATLIWLVQALPYFSASSRARARGAIVYVQNGDSLRFKAPAADAPEEITNLFRTSAGDGERIAQASQNGRYIAYINDYFSQSGVKCGQLFLCDFASSPALDAPAASQPALLADAVTSEFFFTPDSGHLIYLTVAGDLCASDFKGTWVLDTGVTHIFAHSDSQILFAKDSTPSAANPRMSVYLCSIAEKADDKTLVDSKIADLSDWTASFDKFVYLRAADDGGFDVASCDLKSDNRQTLAVGADRVIAADAASFTALFEISSPNPLRFDHLFTDEFARADALIKEPDLERYPLLNEYYESHDLDRDSEIPDIEESEELAEQSSSFKDDIERYEEKLDRDALRGRLELELADFVDAYPLLYNLHLSRGGITSRLVEGSYEPFDSAVLDIANGIAAWSSVGFKDLRKVPIDTSGELLGGATLSEFLQEKSSAGIVIQKFGGAALPLSPGDGRYYCAGFQLSEKADGIYFALGEGNPLPEHTDNAASLYYASIESGAPGSILILDEEVAGLCGMLSGNRLLYFKERSGVLCDLYALNGNTPEHIGDDVALLDGFIGIKNAGKSLLYCDHYNSAAQSGDLYLYVKESRQLASEVSRFFYRNDSLVYFLRGHKAGKADLYVFSSSGLALVDKDVTAVLE